MQSELWMHFRRIDLHKTAGIINQVFFIFSVGPAN